MRIKSIYVLLIIFISVTLFIFLRDRFLINNRRGITYLKKDMLLAKNPADITKCVFMKKDGTRVDFERNNSGWKITYPIITEGSKYSIDLMINSITRSLPRISIGDVSDLSSYGLEHPNCIILLFSNNSSLPDTIQVGDKAPTSPECYFRIGSSKEIILSSGISIDLLDKSLFHFRNKELYGADVKQIHKIKFKSSKGEFTIEKSGKGWNYKETSSPIQTKIADGFLETLRNSLIYEFTSENIDGLSEFGLDNPKYSITLSTDTNNVTIYFGDRFSDKIYARKSNLDKVLLVKSDILSIFD